MSQSRGEEKKEKETKERKDKGLNNAQLELLNSFVGPITNDDALENALESAGIDIQVVLENKNMDLKEKLFCLEHVMEAKYPDALLDAYKRDNKLNKDELASLQRINQFCLDKTVQYQYHTSALFAPSGPLSFPENVSTSDHYFRKLGPINSQAMQSTAKKLIAETCDHLKRIIKGPLHFAAEKGDISKLKALLESNANPDAPNMDGETPLLLAAKTGQTEIVKILLAAKATPDAVNNDGPDQQWNKVKEYHEKVKSLLEAKTNPDAVNSERDSAILHISGSRSLTESYGVTPLWLAAKNGHTEIVNILLDAKANPELTNKIFCQTPLWIAAEHGHAEVVKILLKANPNAANGSEDETPLIVAAEHGHAEVVNILLEAKANPNAVDNYGKTALLKATGRGHTQIVSILLEAKANPDAVDKHDNTPLQIAANNGHTAIVNLLLKAKANPDGTDENGATPLMVAAQRGHTEVVKSLLEAKANPNMADKDGRTALMIAAYCGHAEIVKSLLEAKANPHMADKNGLTPLSLAAQEGHEAIVALLSSEIQKQEAPEQHVSPKKGKF